MSESDSQETFFFPAQSALSSKILWDFLSDYQKSIEYFFFTVRLATHADEAAERAASVLIEMAKNEDDLRRHQKILDNPSRTFERLKEFGGITSRNITVSIVDGFLWYVSNILQAAIRRKPELLRSSEQIKIEEIFNFSNRRELIDYLIDRKINNLSYGGLKQVERYLSDALGIELFSDEAQKQKMRLFLEIRNIHVHNRGRVNHVFLDRISDFHKIDDAEYKAGKKVHLDFDDLVSFSKNCLMAAIELDSKVCAKFKLERRRVSTWLKHDMRGRVNV